MVLLSTLAINKSVAAQSPRLDEKINLFFDVRQDYTVGLEGQIEFTNNTNTNLSISEYELVLPIIKLKNTKVTKIVPDVYLVDTFRENGSNLFRIKSSQFKPVIIPNGGKVIFTFSAELETPFRELGQIAILDLPFQIHADKRDIILTVEVDKSLPLVMAPREGKSEWSKYRFSLTDATGKTFALLKNDMSVIVTRTSENDENHIVPLAVKDSCSIHEFIECENCGKGLLDGNNNVIFQRQKKDSPLKTVTEYKLSKECLIGRFLNNINNGEQDPATSTKTRYAGLVLYPDSNIIIPAEWEQQYDNKSSSVFYRNTELMEKGFPYAFDNVGIFHIPVASCNDDTECEKIKNELANINKSFSAGSFTKMNSPVELTSQLVDVNISNSSVLPPSYQFEIKNKTNSLGIINSLTLSDNDLFTMNSAEKRVVLPGQATQIQLSSKSRFPVKNSPSELKVLINNSEQKYTYNPSQNLFLDIIYLLGVLFTVVIGIFLLSLLFLFVYNKRYDKKI